LRQRSPSIPKLFLNARPTTLAAERARASEITRQAKSAVEKTFAEVRLGRAVTSGALVPIVESIAASLARNPIALPSVMRLKERRDYTFLHSIAVCALMVGLARELKLPDEDMHDIGLAGLLHDIGKARIPTLLLDKPGPLNAAEMEVMRSHAERGRELLVRSGGFPDIALDVCANHHERIEGTGYPLGKSGPHLSIHARMAAVCDVYDAMTSPRAYRDPLSQSEALELMAGSAGQFDAAVFTAFRTMIATFPAGCIVRLHSERLAVVLDAPAADPISPPVRAFYCAATSRPLPWRDVDTARDLIVGVERAERWNLGDWPALRNALLAGG
jgi:putative nucleotidyltransferase with HDIG domain